MVPDSLTTETLLVDSLAPAANGHPGETDAQRFHRELIEVLNELRVALPGVQLLFGFMLVAPFNQRFTLLTEGQRDVYFAGFLAVAVATALLIAPSVYHRLHFRREIEDKERMLRTFNHLTIAGAWFMLVAINCVIYVITAFVMSRRAAFLTTLGGALGFTALWFALPLSRRSSERTKRPIAKTRS